MYNNVYACVRVFGYEFKDFYFFNTCYFIDTIYIYFLAILQSKSLYYKLFKFNNFPDNLHKKMY